MQDLVENLTRLLLDKKMTLAIAESCTGGLLSAAITHRAGASKIFERAFITYSNAAKTEMLGVPENLIKQQGAVSEQVAESMARGAIERSHADIAVSITGVAGPDGGSAEKPVGLVYFGYALRSGSSGSLFDNFRGDRARIQSQAAARALKHLISVLEK